MKSSVLLLSVVALFAALASRADAQVDCNQADCCDIETRTHRLRQVMLGGLSCGGEGQPPCRYKLRFGRQAECGEDECLCYFEDSDDDGPDVDVTGCCPDDRYECCLDEETCASPGFCQ